MPRQPAAIFEIIDAGGRALYLLSLPQGAIKELYFGIRTDDEMADNLYYKATELHPHLTVYECNLNKGNLTVGFGPYRTIAECAAG
jgi:hypothetical protein